MVKQSQKKFTDYNLEVFPNSHKTGKTFNNIDGKFRYQPKCQSLVIWAIHSKKYFK